LNVVADQSGSVVVRRIRADDAMAYREIRLRALKTDPHAFGSTYENASSRSNESWVESATRNASSDDSAILLAARDDELVGLAATMREALHREIFGVYQVWVAPEARRAGVGTRLMAAIEHWAIEHGASSLALLVTDAAQSARRLYEHCGFLLDGRSEPSPHEGVMEHGMTKQLHR
jgi:GNAT superfamily N-acetyltransferase